MMVIYPFREEARFHSLCLDSSCVQLGKSQETPLDPNEAQIDSGRAIANMETIVAV